MVIAMERLFEQILQDPRLVEAELERSGRWIPCALHELLRLELEAANSISPPLRSVA